MISIATIQKRDSFSTIVVDRVFEECVVDGCCSVNLDAIASEVFNGVSLELEITPSDSHTSRAIGPVKGVVRKHGATQVTICQHASSHFRERVV